MRNFRKKNMAMLYNLFVGFEPGDLKFKHDPSLYENPSVSYSVTENIVIFQKTLFEEKN